MTVMYESEYRNYSELAHEVFGYEGPNVWYFHIHETVAWILIDEWDYEEEERRKKAVELIQATIELVKKMTFAQSIPFEFKGFKLIVRKRVQPVDNVTVSSGLVVEFDPLQDDAA